MEPTLGVPFLFMLVYGLGTVISAGGIWSAYRLKPSPLRRLSLTLCIAAFVGSASAVLWSASNFALPQRLENTGKTWLPLAVLEVSLRDADGAALVEELTTFANERRAEMLNLPKPNRTRMDFQIVLTPDSYWKTTGTRRHALSLSLPIRTTNPMSGSTIGKLSWSD
jgi:hypothetical protein